MGGAFHFAGGRRSGVVEEVPRGNDVPKNAVQCGKVVLLLTLVDRRQPSPLGIDPHFPAIAVIPEIADCGIVRAARGSDLPAVDGDDAKNARGSHGIESGVGCGGGGFLPVRRNGAGRTHLSRVREGTVPAARADAARRRQSRGNRARLLRRFSWPGRNRLSLAGRLPPSKGNRPRP